ncbi:MAG: hypothetical protein RPR91_06030 [Colwellia sp.]
MNRSNIHARNRHHRKVKANKKKPIRTKKIMLHQRSLISNLHEAMYEIKGIITSINAGKMTNRKLQFEIEHVYHHLNFAWNVRNEYEDTINKCSDENFIKWSKYPLGDIEEYKVISND